MQTNFVSSTDSVNQDFLIISAQHLNGIYKIDLKTHILLGNPMASDMYPMAIDYDPVGERIYWADVSDEEIHSAFLNGTDSKILQGWEKGNLF